MKRLILIFLLIPSLCFGADAAKIMGVASDPSGTNNVNKVDAITWGTTAGNATKVMGVAAAAAANPCSAYLICQGFEGTGYDNSESWTEVPATGSVNEDSTTSPLVGSQSLLVSNGSYGETIGTYASFTAQDTVYAYVRWKTDTNVQQSIITIMDGSGNSLCDIRRITGGAVKSICNGNQETVGTMSLNTEYHVWARYTKSTSNNGICSVGFSTNGTEPTTGDNFASYTSCTETAQAARIFVGGYGNDNTLKRTFDKVRVKTTSIGSNPD